jgi:hypothetical protein
MFSMRKACYVARVLGFATRVWKYNIHREQMSIIAIQARCDSTTQPIDLLLYVRISLKRIKIILQHSTAQHSTAQ